MTKLGTSLAGSRLSKLSMTQLMTELQGKSLASGQVIPA